MKKNYDMSEAKRGAVLPHENKIRITIYLDSEVVSRFREEAEKVKIGYQTLINEELKRSLVKEERIDSPNLLRKIIREELAPIKKQAVG